MVRQVQLGGSFAVRTDPTQARRELPDDGRRCLLEEWFEMAGQGEVEQLGTRGRDGGAPASRQLPQDGPTHEAAAAGDQHVPLAEGSEHGGTIYRPQGGA